jgi:hypothetical protein
MIWDANSFCLEEPNVDEREDDAPPNSLIDSTMSPNVTFFNYKN